MKKLVSVMAIAILALTLSGLNVFAQANAAATGTTSTDAPVDKNAAPAGSTITAVPANATATTVPATATAIVPAAANNSQYELEDVIITGTKTKLKIKDSPVAASVVTQDNISDNKAVVFSDDALTGVTGVQVRNLKGTQTTAVAIRDLPEWWRSLVLLDGFSIQNVNNARPFWNLIPLDLIDRVEVVRGPFSSLYGKFAVGGVVNFITKEPEGRDFIFDSSYDSDGIRTIKVNFSDKPIDQFAYYIGVEDTNTDGYPYHQYVLKTAKAVTYTASTFVTGYQATTDSQGNQQYIIGEAARQQLEDVTINGKFYYIPSTTQKVSLLLNYSRWDQPTGNAIYGHSYLVNQATGAGVTTGTVGLAGTNQVISLTNSDFYRGAGYNGLWSGVLNYEGQLNDIVSLTAGAQLKSGPWKHTIDNISTTATAYSGYATSTSDLNLNLERVLNVQTDIKLPSNHVTIGVSNDNSFNTDDTAIYSNWTDQSTKTVLYQNQRLEEDLYAAFAQDEWKIAQPLTAYVGARFDSWTLEDGRLYDLTTGLYDSFSPRTENVFSPKISLVFEPIENAKIRVSAGTAFNPPPEADLLPSSLVTTSSSVTTSIPSPLLNPETDNAWEAGGEFTLPTRTTLSATYFQNYLSNLVYLNTTITYNGGIQYTTNQYLNAGKAEIKGVETEIDQKITDTLSLFGNYTYANSIITANSAVPASVGKQIPNTAQHSGAAGIDYILDKLAFDVTEVFASKRYVLASNLDTVNGVQGSYDPYAVTNIKISYNYNSNAKITFGIDNIWDLTYYSNYVNNGRSYNLGVDFKFQ
jgi:iron complex outermembrane receptor protein